MARTKGSAQLIPGTRTRRQLRINRKELRCNDAFIETLALTSTITKKSESTIMHEALAHYVINRMWNATPELIELSKTI